MGIFTVFHSSLTCTASFCAFTSGLTPTLGKRTEEGKISIFWLSWIPAPFVKLPLLTYGLFSKNCSSFH